MRSLMTARMAPLLAALLLLLTASAAPAAVLLPGDLLVETTSGWGRLDPATGTVTALPWGPSSGVVGRVWDAKVAPSGTVWATGYFDDAQSSCACAGGIGTVDPATGAITWVEDGSGQPLVVGQPVPGEYKAWLAVDEANHRVFASFSGNTSAVDITLNQGTLSAMMGSGPWTMDVLSGGSIVAAGPLGGSYVSALIASPQPYAHSQLIPTLAGFSYAELVGPWLALADSQTALLSLEFSPGGAGSTGIFAVDLTTGAASLLLEAPDALSKFALIVAGGGLAYTANRNGLYEIDLATGTSRLVHSGDIYSDLGITRLVQVVPTSVPEPTALSLLAGAAAALGLRRRSGRRAGRPARVLPPGEASDA